MRRLLSVIMTVLLVAFAAVAGPVEDGLADLAKSRSSAGSSSGAEAMEALAKSRAEGGKASGRGIDAGIADIDTYRAEQKALAEKQERARLEEEAWKQDEAMKKDCACILNSCSTGLKITVTRTCSTLMGEELRQCQKEEREERERVKAEKAWEAAHRAEIEEENRRRSEARRAQRKVCEDWKAAGPTADSEAFKARLRQQDQAIAEAERVSAEKARQRDAMIAADARRAIAAADRVEADRIRAENDKRAAASAAQQAEAAMELAKAAAAKEKLRQWCLADPVNLGNCACGEYTSLRGETCSK
jgi:hypothetical protein